MPSQAGILLFSLQLSSVPLQCEIPNPRKPSFTNLRCSALCSYSHWEKSLQKTTKKESCTCYKVRDSIPALQQITACQTIRLSCCFCGIMLFKFALTLKWCSNKAVLCDPGHVSACCISVNVSNCHSFLSKPKQLSTFRPFAVQYGLIFCAASM